MDQQDLLKALEQLNGSIEELINQIPIDRLDWRPHEKMRTVEELANHLVQIPAIDLQILQGGTQEEVRAMEGHLHQSDPAELLAVWQGGVQAVREFFLPLTPDQFRSQVGKAFYGHEAPLQEWLLEIITHAYHHRAQLFTYLKLLGRPVDMFTLYL